MTSSLVPTDFPYLTAEDFVLLSRGRNLGEVEILQLVGHLSSEVLVEQLNRFINLSLECQKYNIDDTDAEAVSVRLLNVLSIRPGGVNIVLHNDRIINLQLG
jgi:hypothetical protein